MKNASEEKKDNTYFICCCFTACFLLLYLNNNLPIFQQIFAHLTYVPTAIDEDSDGRSISCSFDETCFFKDNPNFWAYYRNDARCGQEYPVQTYTVNGIKYSLKYSTYIFDKPCSAGIKAYYFPLNPKWSVADKRLPSAVFWNDFLQSSGVLFIWLSYFLIYSIRLLNKPYLKGAVQEILHEFQQRRTLNSIVLSLFVPLVVVLVVHIIAYVLGFEDYDLINYPLRVLSLLACVVCFLLTSRNSLIWKVLITIVLAYSQKAVISSGPTFVLCAFSIYLLYCLYAEIGKYFSRTA